MTVLPRASARTIRPGELLLMVSATIALTALSIDMMLPAFGEIRASFDLDPDSNETAAIITSFMLGLSAAQLFYGTLSDRFGRKPILYAGMAAYVVGAAGAALAPTFGFLLASRVLWGIGSAAPRVLAISIIRDTYSGDQMARAMSFVMAVFILVPVLAPSVGAAIVSVSSWRVVFWACAGYAVVLGVWLVRLPETLDPARRLELRFGRVAEAARFVLTNRQTMAHMAAMTVLFGILVSYLATSELIFTEVFDLEAQFPIIFGALAAVMGIAVLWNASVVERFGSARIVRWVLAAYSTGAAALLVLCLATDGRPAFWPFAILLGGLLFLYAFLVPNMNTLAMDPMGSVAGTASAVIGTAQIGGGALLGAIIDRAYDGTVTPLAVALLVSALAATGLVAWARRDAAG